MKRILMSAAALAALGFAAPAFAANPQSITVTANNPAKCDINAATTSVALPADAMTDANGFARTDVGSSVATALTGLSITAWCTGAHNGVVVSRTALVRNATTGVADTNGFNNTLLYDLEMDIAGAVRSDAGADTDGTSDGAGNGPGEGVGAGISVSDFGASAPGAAVTFANSVETPISTASSTNGADGADGAFSPSTNRLTAGDYTSTVTIQLFPVV